MCSPLLSNLATRTNRGLASGLSFRPHPGTRPCPRAVRPAGPPPRLGTRRGQQGARAHPTADDTSGPSRRHAPGLGVRVRVKFIIA
eukprot:scaffold37130_cov76-Phaeocystis_antarctica.AAC.2